MNIKIDPQLRSNWLNCESMSNNRLSLTILFTLASTDAWNFRAALLILQRLTRHPAGQKVAESKVSPAAVSGCDIDPDIISLEDHCRCIRLYKSFNDLFSFQYCIALHYSYFETQGRLIVIQLCAECVSGSAFSRGNWVVASVSLLRRGQEPKKRRSE